MSQMIFGQNNSSNGLQPSFAPPSPQAFSMTEYGKNGANEFRGKPSINIPLYNYKNGNLEVPITLNYNSAGVKVNDLSTWTGIGWNLSVGGVINRTVKDLADEIAVRRVLINEEDFLDSTKSDCSPNSQYYYNLCREGQDIDTELDVFNFSFNGYSGSFYLDANLIPVIVNNDKELKISIIGNLAIDKKFIVIDPQGVKYYFGDNETENSATITTNIHDAIFSNTSFYLYKIEHPLNGLITFEYETKFGGGYLNKTYSQNVNFENPIGDGLGIYSSFITKQSNNSLKLLKKIKNSSTLDEVEFNTTTTMNRDALFILDNIIVRNNTIITKKIDFTYLAKNSNTQSANDFNTASRFFLEKLEINKNVLVGNSKSEKYNMVYNDPTALPARLSNSQDFHGFFNGKTNETLLISHPAYAHPSTTFYADRNPVFEKASKGALIELKYPTGGFTKFEYEPTLSQKEVYTKYGGEATGVPLNQVPRIDPDFGDINFPAIFKDQMVNIKIITTNPNNRNRVPFNLVITDLSLTTNNQQIFPRMALGHSFSIPYQFLKNRNYKVEINFVNPLGSDDAGVSARFEFTVMSGYTPIDGLSVRLKRQTDFKDTSSLGNISRYYYGNIDLLNVNTIRRLNISPRIDYNFNGTSLRINVTSEGKSKYSGSEETDFNYDIVSISFGGDNFENGGVEKFFSKSDGNESIFRREVTMNACYPAIFGGGITCPSTFGPPQQNTVINISRSLFNSFEYTDNATYNGTLLGERVYKNINGSLYKIKETKYNYNVVNLGTVNNFVGRLLFGSETVKSICNGVQLWPLSSCYLGIYKTKSMKQVLNNTITKEFLDPLPMSNYYPFYVNDFDYSLYVNFPYPSVEAAEASYKKITTTQTYTYGNLRGLPTQITTTTSDSSKSKITKNIYADQASTLTGLTAAQLANANTLLAQNNVAAPLQVEQYQNSDLLSKQRTVFKTGAVPSQILPDVIQTAKGTANLEDRVVFLEYDPKGNPSIVMMKDGSKTKYFYNTDNQVIIKIENYTGAANVFTNPMGTIPACTFINQYPTAMVSVYNYNATTKQITSIVAPDCKTAYYEYNALNQLYRIKDQLGNIVQEFDHNYKN